MQLNNFHKITVIENKYMQNKKIRTIIERMSWKFVEKFVHTLIQNLSPKGHEK